MTEYIPLYNLGIDIGSTTMKVVLTDSEGQEVYNDYRRHNADIAGTARTMIEAMKEALGDIRCRTVLTGSVGMGVAERTGLAFVQEVVASVETVSRRYPEARMFVDMGGEDTKMVFLSENKVPDIRMNGSCAGGTGAFIDQTAVLLGVTADDIDRLAGLAERVHPIASRCGVFSKTDIQNLMARRVPKEEIAASVLQAVALQAVASLARGMEVRPKVLFCGGPFAYMKELQRHFMQVLHIEETDCIKPHHPHLIPASGCAILAETNAKGEDCLSVLQKKLQQQTDESVGINRRLPALFENEADYCRWKAEKKIYKVPTAQMEIVQDTATFYLGADSGSTTTKIVLLNEEGEVVYKDYRHNNGDSFGTFSAALNTLHTQAPSPEKMRIVSCVTGYGENLLKTTFGLDYGMVETMAHFTAAHHILPEVSFVLDIGGQDMKAIWVENGTIRRIEINEACSSGCGSFLETFGRSLGYESAEFARLACQSVHPCDLGTRCTVFMNSCVKQAMREGASVEDIAAGFSYSVVKNCLYKVLKLRDTKKLGKHIVVQGGTFRNHSIVRALEKLTGLEVSLSDMPELMGAYGAALYARKCDRRD